MLCNSTPTKDNSNMASTSKIVDALIPSPFKDTLFWPHVDKTIKKKRKAKEILPSVISSLKGKQYFMKKEEEKKLREREKKERQRIRLEKKVAKELQILEKKKKKKLNEEWSSDSSIELIEESEGEGDDWDKFDNDSDSDKENLNDIKDNDIRELLIGDYVIIVYQKMYYPGVIEAVDTTNDSFNISTMEASGNNYKWPAQKDVLWYNISDVICKIKTPIPVNKRGAYKVPEMSSYSTLQ